MPSFIGLSLVAAAASLWASAGLVGAFSPDLPAAALGEARALAGSIALCMLIGPQKIMATDLRCAWRPILLASACLAAFQWSFFAAVERAGPDMASVLSAAVAPFAADAIGHARRRAQPPGRWLLAAAGAAAGMVLPASAAALPVWGLVLAVLSGISYALYTSAAASLERAAGGSGLAATALALAGAAIVLLPAAAGQAEQLASLHGLAITAYLGVVTVGLAYWLFMRGLRHLSPGAALGAAFVQPVAAIVLSMTVLHEHAGRHAWMSIAVAGCCMLLRRGVPLRSLQRC